MSVNLPKELFVREKPPFKMSRMLIGTTTITIGVITSADRWQQIG